MKWLVLACLVSCAPGEATRTQAVINGELDRGDLPVVAITGRRIRCEDSARLTCSGTVIGPDVVLTSAHCVTAAAAGSLEVFVGTPVGDHDGRFIDVGEVAVHPQYDPAAHAHDLALLRLAEAAPVVPAPLPTVEISDAAIGQTARVVGYGGARADMAADGNKRDGRMTLADVAAFSLSAAATPSAPAMACGDDGGPMFVTLPPNGDQLLGVIIGDGGRCDTVTEAARIDIELAGFIRPYLATPAPGPSSIPLADVCGSDCARDADCPAAMGCTDGRCRVAGAVAGNYMDACSSDAQCGASTCARVAPDDCRCHVSCAQLEEHLASCAAGGSGAGLVVGGFVAVALATRRRRARGPRGRCASSTACRGR